MSIAVVGFVVTLNIGRLKREFGVDDTVTLDGPGETNKDASMMNKSKQKTSTSPYQDDYLDDLLEMDSKDMVDKKDAAECILNDLIQEFKTKVESEFSQYASYCMTVNWKNMI